MTASPADRLTRLFAESREALSRYVRRLVRSRDTADEIVQEAYLRTYEHADSLRTPRAFLFRTARNLATDTRRHDRVAISEPMGESDPENVVSGDGSIENLLIADEASRLLKQAIDRLPPQCHAALTLKLFHGQSYREIAAALGVTEKTVEKHIARGMDRIQTYLNARYKERSP